MTDRRMPSGNRILLVEGQDDKHVVLHICERQQYTPPCISDKGSIDKLLHSISPELKVSGRQTVGILADANDDPHSRWTSLKDRLQNNGIELPSRGEQYGTIIESKPQVGIWLMPDNRSHGTLEHFVEQMIPAEDPVWPLAQQYIDNIPQHQRRFKEQHSQKAKIHAWLAARETPGLYMGTAIKAQELDIESDLANTFFNWLKNLFDLSPL